MVSQSVADDLHVDLLHEIGSRLAVEDPFHEVLNRIVDFASYLVKCDSCLIYSLRGEELVLRASKNPHAESVDRLTLRVGRGRRNRLPMSVREWD